MKRFFFFFLVFFQTVFADELPPALQELLGIFDIPIEEAQAQTKLCWMQIGKERWEFDHRYEEMKEQLWPIFDELNLLKPILIKHTHYNYALVHGALLSRVQMRLNVIIAEWKRGVRFDQIVFLTGQRPLLVSERQAIGEPLVSETDMVKWVYSQAEMPQEMRALPVTFVDAQESPRPCTADTVRAWLSLAPRPGNCLAVSNQPYICYQNAVMERLLPQGFTIETVGAGISADTPVAVLLDTVAKWVTQKYENK